MKYLATIMSRYLSVIGLTIALMVPQIGYSQTVDEKPSALAMTGDLVIARPLLLVGTVVGTAVWLVSLPFSLGGGNAMEAAETLVIGPAQATFNRCLGCTRPGYKQEVAGVEEEE